MKLRLLWLLLLAQLLVSCDGLFEYHPNQIILEESEKNLTQKNLNRLLAQPPQDTLTILLMGDTQRFYDATQAFVKKANTYPHIDFVVHLGDISDFGMSQEYQWVHDLMKDLRWPYLTVIGNHDMLGNGRKVYRKMYGAFNYSFVYGTTKFVLADTNGREAGFSGKVPDLDWLAAELTPEPGATWQQAVVLSHVPPFDNDFDPALERPYHETLVRSKRVPLSLHGHKHSWTTEAKYGGQVLYHVTTFVKERGFTLLTLWQGGYRLERVYY
ncbi:metallophosphoesterase [Rufibacter glacialis]|uniref:Metallophosphoesterase n=1 Tax=Rufibacter glacialis TaxID=1259555 RepID=A0A5M8QIL5_9BACT|nr:metallophosphoesterase [Rufibacter glacialis]KAA6434814.1 metallophosphoesterase [Rufibacter glacialis]GGK72645.1 phosphoesterase [Rufibacter glacialis]